MRLALACAVGLSACVPEHGNFPGGDPGDPRPVGSTSSDPGLDAGVSGQPGRIRGRLCRRSDVRGDAPCPTVTGVTLRVIVAETGASDTTAADGSFDLPGTTQRNPITLVTPADDPIWYGTAFPVFLDQSGSVTVLLPLVRRSDLEDVAVTNLVALDESRAVLAIEVRRNRSGATGFTAGDLDGVAPLYETGDPLTWTTSGPTGPTGSVLWLDVGPGTRTVRLTSPTGTTTAYAVPTLAGTITLTPIDL